MTTLTPDQQERADRAIALIARKQAMRQTFTSENGQPGPASLFRDCLELVRAYPAECGALVKAAFRVPWERWTDAERRASRTMTQEDSSLGQATSLPEPVGAAFINLLTKHSVAYRFFNVLPLETDQHIVPILKGRATAAWRPKAAQGEVLFETTAISAAGSQEGLATLAALIEASGEVVADGGPVAAAVILAAIVDGIDFALTRTCCQGDGSDDLVSGGFTGIFIAGDVPVVNAAAGHTDVSSLTAADFINAVAAVSPDALSHTCGWITAPGNLPELLRIRTSAEIGGEPLLKPPTTPDGTWTLLGFPVVWASGAPAANEPGDKVLAFGRGESYVVGIREKFEFAASDVPGYFRNTRLLRGLIRARCELADPASFATLRLAAE